jgi:hypothetical protein
MKNCRAADLRSSIAIRYERGVPSTRLSIGGSYLAHDPTNLLQGTLDLMILKALALEEMHGLGISRRIELITKGTFQVKPGSLLPLDPGA